jgi:carbonic anhydrase
LNINTYEIEIRITIIRNSDSEYELAETFHDPCLSANGMDSQNDKPRGNHFVSNDSQADLAVTNVTLEEPGCSVRFKMGLILHYAGNSPQSI